MPSRADGMMEQIETKNYTGERSCLYHFLGSIEMEVALMTNDKCEMKSVLDGPPSKFTE